MIGGYHECSYYTQTHTVKREGERERDRERDRQTETGRQAGRQADLPIPEMCFK